MDKDEKIALKVHMVQYKQVLKELNRRFRIPWQEIVKMEGQEDKRLKEWFPETVLPFIRNRVAERLYAERAGKILFNLFDDDENETDAVVLQAKKKLRNIVQKV